MSSHRINKKHFRVALFGSARIQMHDPRYKLVHQLAKRIAQENIDIVTGGGPGLMDAASYGHHEGRGNNHIHSIGLTIKLPHEQMDSYHLDIKKNFSKFSGRLDKFMMLSNVVVVAPGGIGTLLEFFYTWQLMQVEHICNTPIILLGDMWPELIAWIKRYPLRKKLMSKKDFEHIYLVKNVTQAMEIITQAHETFKKGGENFCVNYKRYK